MGYRPAGLVIRTSLHDHGGECDTESDEAWAKFSEAVQKAVEEFLPGPGGFTWVGHVDCQCASCEEEEDV